MTVIVTMQGDIAGPEAKTMYDAVRARFSKGGVDRIIFDAREIGAFDMATINESKVFVRAVESQTRRIVVVTTKATVRFGMSAIQLVTRLPLHATATLEEAYEKVKS